MSDVITELANEANDKAEQIARLKADNAKLRELCERCAIELYVNGNVEDAATENLFDDMRDLGVEVSE